jgi:hypothetical protein
MSERREVKDPVKDALPVLALAAMEGADGAGKGVMSQLLQELASDLLAERKKKAAQREAIEKNAILAAQDEKRYKDQEKRRCSHRNQIGDSRLSGQILSNGQLCLVCKWCHKEYHEPPIKELGQEAPPRELYPTMDEIGDASGGRTYSQGR